MARTRRNVTLGSLAAALVLAVVAGWAGFEAWTANVAQKSALESEQQAKAAQKSATENKSRALKALSDATAANHRVTQVQQIARQTGDLSLGRSVVCCSPSMRRRCNLTTVSACSARSTACASNYAPARACRWTVTRRMWWPRPTHPDGRWLAMGDADGLVRLYDLTAPDPRTAVHDLAGHRGAVAGLVFAADSRGLVSAGSDGTLRLWQVDAASQVAGRVISVNALGPIRALAASPDGQWLAFGGESGQLCLWRWLADGPEEAPCDPAWRDGSPVTTVMFSAKGRWLATTCTGACKASIAPVRLWDLSAQGADRGPKRLVPRSALTEPSLQAIAFSPDETRLGAAYGYVAELWDLTRPDPPASLVGTYPSGGGWIRTLDISADGRWLALGSLSSNDVRLWRLAGNPGEPRGPIILSGHGGPVTVVRFGGDGGWLATAAEDGSLNQWDLAAPQCARRSCAGTTGRSTRSASRPKATPATC